MVLCNSRRYWADRLAPGRPQAAGHRTLQHTVGTSDRIDAEGNRGSNPLPPTGSTTPGGTEGFDFARSRAAHGAWVESLLRYPP